MQGQRFEETGVPAQGGIEDFRKPITPQMGSCRWALIEAA